MPGAGFLRGVRVGHPVGAAADGAGGELSGEGMPGLLVSGRLAGGEDVVGRSHAAEDLQLVVTVGGALDQHSGGCSLPGAGHRVAGRKWRNLCSP